MRQLHGLVRQPSWSGDAACVLCAFTPIAERLRDFQRVSPAPDRHHFDRCGISSILGPREPDSHPITDDQLGVVWPRNNHHDHPVPIAHTERWQLSKPPRRPFPKPAQQLRLRRVHHDAVRNGQDQSIRTGRQPPCELARVSDFGSESHGLGSDLSQRYLALGWRGPAVPRNAGRQEASEDTPKRPQENPHRADQGLMFFLSEHYSDEATSELFG